jgi:hypothetical protein
MFFTSPEEASIHAQDRSPTGITTHNKQTFEKAFATHNNLF